MKKKKKRNFIVDGVEYRFICTAHDDISSFSSQIHKYADAIEKVCSVAKQMGINMEDGLYAKKDKIAELENKIKKLEERYKRLKERNKKLKEQK